MEVTEDFVQKQFQNSGLKSDLSKPRRSTLREGRGSRYKCWGCLAVTGQKNAAVDGCLLQGCGDFQYRLCSS